MSEQEDNLLELPFQIHEMDRDKPRDLTYAVYDARVSLTNYLNYVREGLRTFTEEDRSKFYRFNAMCVRDGYPHMQILVSEFPERDLFKYLDSFSNN